MFENFYELNLIYLLQCVCALTPAAFVELLFLIFFSMRHHSHHSHHAFLSISRSNFSWRNCLDSLSTVRRQLKTASVLAFPSTFFLNFFIMHDGLIFHHAFIQHFFIMGANNFATHFSLSVAILCSSRLFLSLCELFL